MMAPAKTKFTSKNRRAFFPNPARDRLGKATATVRMQRAILKNRLSNPGSRIQAERSPERALAARIRSRPAGIPPRQAVPNRSR